MSNPPDITSENSKTGTAPVSDPPGTTFKAVQLEVLKEAEQDYSRYVATLEDILLKHKSNHDNYYWKRRQEYDNVHRWRRILTWLGVIGIVLTIAAAVVRYCAAAGLIAAGSRFGVLDLWFLTMALLAYGAMTGITFYLQTSDQAGGYFRSVLATFVVRDAWTAFLFEAAKLRLETPKDAPEEKALKQQWLNAAESFCKVIDAASVKEASEWRGAYEATLDVLYKAAAEGVKGSKTELDNTIAELKKVAAEAKDATKPAVLNLDVKFAEPGEAIVTVDGSVAARGMHRSFALVNLKPGMKTIRAEVAMADGKKAVAEKAVLLGQGITNLELSPRP
ncbi:MULTISPECIES: hypothetical protein [unclassified Sinorhizobium]|uniref:hypothetical protein n=1 Tax=unclassified Sinorhizobium TaxID=2613772 RepID=UPI003523DA80